MTEKIYDILRDGKQKLAILIDPDKTNQKKDIDGLIDKIESLKPAFIFVGGSTVDTDDFNHCIELFKEVTDIPVMIFPGGYNQIHPQADGILFLSLISGRNPDYLIGHQIQSAHLLKKMEVEAISTGYLLIEGGKNSSVSYVSQTTPIPSDQENIAINIAIAGEMLGLKAIFLDAGSGALLPIPDKMIKAVKENISVPLIVGGGMKSVQDIENAFEAGADLVVIGNKIEENMDFLLDLINATRAKS